MRAKSFMKYCKRRCLILISQLKGDSYKMLYLMKEVVNNELREMIDFFTGWWYKFHYSSPQKRNIWNAKVKKGEREQSNINHMAPVEYT